MADCSKQVLSRHTPEPTEDTNRMTETDKLDAALQPLGSATAAVKRLGHGEDALRWVLSRYWPASDGSDSQDMSAMDCMVIIIRHICAHSDFLGSSEFEEYVVDGQDAVLRLAMSDLTADTPEMLSRVQKAREAAFKRILAETESPVPFRTLIKMSSLWRMEQFRLYRPLMGKAASSEVWVDEPDGPDASWAGASLLHWDMKSHATFQELLEYKTGSFRDEAGSEFIRHCAEPAFLRVRLVPKQPADDDFSIDAVRVVTLPRISVREEEAKSEGDGKWITHVRKAGGDRYYLMGVVKLRQAKGESDRVRLYDIQGNNVTPSGDPARFNSVLEDSWSMREQSNTYMLFYVRAGPDTAVQGREMEEVHFDSVTPLERRDAQRIGALFKPEASIPKSRGYGDDDEEEEEQDKNNLLKRRQMKNLIMQKIRRRSQSSLAGGEGPQAPESSGEPSVTKDPWEEESPSAAKKSRQSLKEGQKTPERKTSAEDVAMST